MLDKLSVKNSIVRPLKAFLYGMIIYVVTVMFISYLVWILPIPEGYSTYYILVAISLSCLFIGMYMGKCKKRRGFAFGVLYSSIFVILIMLLSTLLLKTESVMTMSALKYLICLLFGSIGGMIGVNLK